jgi:ribose/xylose/arabinose/galactoside ABC-type transport system permease subunit
MSAIVIISGVDSIRPGYGSQYLLLSVLIVVMGGTDPQGGFGTVVGVMLAIFVVQVLQSGLNIMGFSAFFMKTSWGLLLLLLVVFHYFRDSLFRKLLRRFRRGRMVPGANGAE